MQPLVSVLIPCFNSEAWLAETLRSTLCQSYGNIEVVFVDDGSTDGGWEIACTFRSSRVICIRQENQGASAARNRALAEAQGDFIQYLDDDDLLSPDKIQVQVELLARNPPDMLAVCSTVHFFDGQAPCEGLLHDGWPMVDSDAPVEWLIALMGPEQGGMVHPGAWLTPRSIVEKIGPWDLSICPTPMDDGEYFARAVLASKGIRRSSGLSYYRKHTSGLNGSAQRSKAYLWGHFRSLKMVESHLMKRTECNDVRRAMARCFMDLAFNAYPVAREVSAAAVEESQRLGGAKRPRFGTAKGEALAKVLGWKAVRWASHHYHRIKG